MEEFRYVPDKTRTNANKKSLLLAYLLALPPAGLFGAHRLYLGHEQHFVWYSLTFGNCFFGWIIDLLFLPKIVEMKNESLHVSNSKDMEKRYFINTLVLWFPIAGILGAHRYYQGDVVHGVFYTLTAGNIFLSWFADGFRIASLARQERWDTFDAVLLWLPPSGLLGGHRYFSGHLLHAISYSLTMGNAVMGWILDGFRLPTLMKNSPGSNRRLEKQRQQKKLSSSWNTSSLQTFTTMEDLPTEPHSYNDTSSFKPTNHHHQFPDSGEAEEGEEDLDFSTPSLPELQSPSPSPLDISTLDAYALWIPPLGLFGFHNYYLKRFPCAVLASVLPPIGLLIWLVDSCYIVRFISQKRAMSLTTPLSSLNSSASSSSDIGVEYPENYVALVEIATPSD